MKLRLTPSRVLFVGLATVTMSRGLLACGPDFPNCYLSNSFDQLSQLPALSFESELAQLIKIRSRNDSERTAEQEDERREVQRALLASGMPPNQVDRELSGYQRERPPAALPPEFQLYARGALAWREDRRDDAITAWRELLELPTDRRRARSVWAAFMLGRALCDTEPARAREFCRLTRELAAHDFADSQHLADASLGWEARAFLHERDYLAALRLYSRHLAAGDPSAVASLQFTLVRIFSREPEGELRDETVTTERSEPLLSAIAADRELRGVVTAWFAARGGRSLRWAPEAAHQFRRWIGSLPNAKDLAPEEADRWCWAAYQNGMWSEARALAALAPQDAPASEWVRAMLLLRAGSVDDAAEHLARAAAGFATNTKATGDLPLVREAAAWCPLQQPLGDEPMSHLAGVRGVLALHRTQYVEALRLFLSAQHWIDAAYVAERVLTPDELVEFTNRFTAETKQAQDTLVLEQLQQLRNLTARRLVRLGQFDRAEEFFSTELGDKYRAYLANVRGGFDPKKGSRDRADALWAAAKLIRELGMDLQGTELEPDYAVWGGAFRWPQLEAYRGFGAEANVWFREDAERLAAASKLVPLQPSGDELECVKLTSPPEHRFHYRYRAAELAWLSAALLPNDDVQTATVLHTAGRWVASREPAQADLFYKTLVIRCPNTDLGRRAEKAHWFVRDVDSQMSADETPRKLKSS